MNNNQASSTGSMNPNNVNVRFSFNNRSSDISRNSGPPRAPRVTNMERVKKMKEDLTDEFKKLEKQRYTNADKDEDNRYVNKLSKKMSQRMALPRVFAVKLNDNNGLVKKVKGLIEKRFEIFHKEIELDVLYMQKIQIMEILEKDEKKYKNMKMTMNRNNQYDMKLDIASVEVALDMTKKDIAKTKKELESLKSKTTKISPELSLRYNKTSRFLKKAGFNIGTTTRRAPAVAGPQAVVPNVRAVVPNVRAGAFRGLFGRRRPTDFTPVTRPR